MTSNKNDSHFSKNQSSNDSTNQFNNYTQQFQKSWETMKDKIPGMDPKTILSHHRHNLDSMSEVNKMVIEMMKTLSQMQTKYMQQAFSDFNHFVRNMMVKKDKIDWSECQEQMQKSLHGAIDHSINVGQQFIQTHQEVSQKIQEKIQEGTQEMKKSMGESHH